MKDKKLSTGRNVFQLFYSTILSSGVFALILILLANYLDTKTYAMLSVAISISLVLSYFTDLGISNNFLRECSKHTSPLLQLISTYLKSRVLFWLASLLLLGILIDVFYHTNIELTTVLYHLCFLMVTGLTLQSVGITYFQSQERMHGIGLIRTFHATTLLVFILSGTLASVSTNTIAFLFGFAYVVSGVFALILVFRQHSISFKTPLYRGIYKGMFAFFVSGLLIMTTPQLGPILLEKNITLEEVGLFAVSFRIPSALYQIPGVIAGAFYPVLFRYHHTKQDSSHLALQIDQIKWMGYLGLGLTIPLIYLSEPLIRTLFGTDWTQASIFLTFLAPVLFLQSMSIALADGLTTKGLHKRRTIVQVCIFVLTMVGYTMFSRHLGLKGAIGTAVMVEIFALVGYLVVNPARSILWKRSIRRLCFFFVISVSFILFTFPNSPFFATSLHLLLLGILFYLDVSTREKLRMIFKSWQLQWISRVRAR